jgi:hypothetical protein
VIETIGPIGHIGGRRTTIFACVTFLPGAVAGGVLTFGSLALLGDLLHGSGGRAAYLVAAAMTIAAAVLEARGTRIVPQIRRQLPEHWRRVMPMPLAAALYGLLLGIGFTTFVLSFGVWALAGVSLAIGDPQLGLVLGAGFGLGRALPVVALAPVAGGPAGIRATELMCERPGVYLGLRRGDALALGLAALALVFMPASAGARGTLLAGRATDPSASGDAIAFQHVGGGGVLVRGGAQIPLAGSSPAVGGHYLATISGGTISLQNVASLALAARIPAPGADAVAVSDGWLVYRAELSSGEGLFARSIFNPSAPGPVISLTSVGASAQLSRPGLDGEVVVYGIAGTRGSRISQRILGTGKHRVLVHSPRLLLFDPAVDGKSFIYTRTDSHRSRLMVRRRHRPGPGRVVYSVKASNLLWTSALTDSRAYVTVIDPSSGGAGAQIVSLSRSHTKRLREHGPRGGGNHPY